MIKTVALFDIDGTLLHTRGAGHLGACRALASAFGAEPTSGEITFAGRTDRGIVSDLFRLHDIEESAENWHLFQTHYLQHLKETVAETAGVVLPGVELLLRVLDEPGYSEIAVGLLTGNTQQAAKVKLAYFGLDQFFLFGGFGDDWACRNDAARAAFENSKTFAGGELKAEQIVVIGDTPNDIVCAKAIEARVIAVSTGSYSEDELTEAEPDHLLADLTDTDAVLSILCG
ncbi:MAG: HAD family hydrolase [Planctomycetales bacterium]|nr:HAD family hydrolase [Planctomycetales bacterium]